jgi:hypothetical protein
MINDDGLAGMTDEEATKRVQFCRENNIGWVARPKHGYNFVRRGKFKKSIKHELCPQSVHQGRRRDAFQTRAALCTREDRIHRFISGGATLRGVSGSSKVLKNNPRAQAEGDIRVGEIILIVDSDTRVVSPISSPRHDLLNSRANYENTARRLSLVRCSRDVPLPRSRDHTALHWGNASSMGLFREWYHLFHKPDLHLYSVCNG